MSLATGSKLGPYEILSPIGAGGMGEVYRARDTRLDRTVAVKVLPAHLSSSPESRQRFEREAKTISQLSHPHICALYDVGREGEIEYLVMEYLEGDTLAERLAKGPLSLEQMLRFGIQIADALDKAHRQGIVHRDLKPGNVMITKSGVKLLDFGLAKAFERSLDATGREQTAAAQHPMAGLNLTALPTQIGPLTKEGAILGTVQYMAPEQLEGRDADARTDVFALGCVLYEMATGRKAFAGANQASLISSILRDDPAPISQVQPLAPRAFDRIVRTCLAKDPEDRWQTARDVGLQLEFAASERSAEIPAPVPQRRRRAAWLPWLVAVAFAALAAIAMFRAAKPTTRMTHAIRFGLAPPENGSFFYSVEAPSLAVSPDGLQLAYVAGPPGARRIYRRLLADLEARPIPGTEGATSLLFSPDGESLAFFLPGKLKRLEISGGAPVPICDVPLVGAIWGTWGRGGNIIFAGAHGQAIYRVSAAGGAPAEAIRLDAARGETRILWPFFLPDGERFLYSIRHRDGRGDLMLAEPGKKPRLLMPMQSLVQYSDPGYLLFAREGALLAQRFDPETGRTSGPPFSVAEHVRYFLSTGCVSFAASQSGTVVYQSQEDVRHLKWFDRTGRELGTVGPPGKYNRISMSPDGRRLFFDRAREGIWTFDIWSVDLERGMETPVTTGPETESMPLWLPGGRLVYSSVRGNPPQLIGRDLATGKEDELVPGGSFQQPQTVSPDGQFLLYTMRGERGFFDIWKYPLSGAGKPVAFLESPFDKSSVRFSPDGRFLAMITGESGRPEVYVTAFPGPSERIRVSTGGAGLLRWSRDGRELFYVSPDRQLMSVPIRTTPSLELGTPTPLFTLEGRGSWPDFEVAPDGRRVLAIVPEVVADELPLSVVVNWTPEAGK